MTERHLFKGYIGTYTKGDSEGIYSFVLDTEKGQISDIKAEASLGNPTYIAISEDNQYLYSVIKKDEAGGVAAFSIKENGELDALNDEVTEGSSPCYVSVNRENRNVVAANYHRGLVESYIAKADGAINPATSIIQHHGSGPNQERQEKPHVHYSDFTPDEKYVVVVDLGIDKVVTYELNDGVLKEINSLALTPGSGPRHLVFHPNGKYAYVLTELSSDVVALKYNAEDGSFEVAQEIPAIPESQKGKSFGSAIHISSDGLFLYAANRGHDSIAVFSVDQDTGKLTFIEHTATEGEWPRDFMIDPTEEFLVASNQNSSNLVLYSRNVTTGKLKLLQSDVTVPDPVCVKFLNVK